MFALDAVTSGAYIVRHPGAFPGGGAPSAARRGV